MTTTNDEPYGANLTMQVLDRHVEVATWAESEGAREFLGGYIRSQLDRHAEYTTPADHAADIERAYADALGEMLGLAETYWVAPDMVDVIGQAATTIEQLPLRKHLIPASHGFVMFADTLVFGVDEHDQPWGADAFSWSMIDETTWYNEAGDQNRDPGVLLVWWARTDADWIARSKDAWDMHLPWAVPVHITGWTYDVPWAQSEDAVRDAEIIGRSRFTLDEVGDMQRKIVLSTLTLLGDEIVRVWKERAPRGARRRAERRLHTPEPGDVHIVDLRHVRTIGKPDIDLTDDGEPVMWTHRWIVREHWRTIHRGDPEKERQVFVKRHVKGPENRPLIVKDRLSRLVR